MPINPEIPLQGRPATFDISGPLSILQQGRQMQMQQQRLAMEQEQHGQQMQIGAIGLQEKQLELQDQQTMRQMLPKLLQDNNGDWEKAAQGLTPYVAPKTAFGLQTMFLGNAEKKAQINKANADAAQANAAVAQKERDYMGNLALGVQRSDYNPAVFDVALQHAGELNPAYADHITQIRQAVKQNPDSLKQIIDGLVNGSEVATKEAREQGADKRAQEEYELKKPGLVADSSNKEFEMLGRTIGQVKDQDGYNQLIAGLSKSTVRQLPTAFDPATTPAAIQRLAVPVKDQPEWDLNSAKAKLGLMGNSEYDQFLMQYARSLGKTPATLTPDEGLASFSRYAEMKADPVLRDSAIQMKNLQASMLKLQQGQVPTDQDYQALAKAVIDKTIAPAQFSELRAGRMGGIGVKVFTLAKQMDPNFNMQRADAEFRAMEKTENDFTSGKEATLVRSNNNALEHLALLDQARIALKNGDIQKLNQLGNWFGAQTGSSASTVFDHIAQRVNDEVTKAFIPGGGTAGDREHSGAGYGSKLGDAQIAANIRADVQLMDSQQRHLTDQYARGTYGKGGQQLFTPEAMATRDRLLAGASGIAPLPATLTAADVGKVYLSTTTGKKLKITAVNPQDGKQFQSQEVK